MTLHVVLKCSHHWKIYTTTLFDLGGLQVELEEMLGVSVDLLTPGDLPPRLRAQVLAEAVPVSENRLPDYLDHLLEAARLACSYVADMSKDDFLADKRTQQAVILNLIVIGEAATRLLKDHGDFLDRDPDVPWRNMKGMRNRIAHGYFDINLDVVWETAQTALPQ